MIFFKLGREGPFVNQVASTRLLNGYCGLFNIFIILESGQKLISKK